MRQVIKYRGFWYLARTRSRKIQVNLQNSQKHVKYHEIRQKSYQIHVDTTYLKLILAFGAV